MPLPLDTLLFWAGLGLLVVGLYVFISGKSASDEKKRQNNRFEAFGIKIDVNNPSLILILLGVVLMLAPKMLPQPSAELEQSETAVDASPLTLPIPDTPEPDSSSVQTETAQQQPVDPVVQPTRLKQPKPEPKPSTTVSAKIQPTVKRTPQVAIQPTRKIPTKTIENPVVRAEIKKPVPVVAQLQSPETLVKKVKELTPATGNKPAPEPPKPSLVVLVQADADRRAGIKDSAESYGARVSAELAGLAQEIIGDDANIKQQTVKALRQLLKREAKPYQTLCKRAAAGRLLLADLEIPFAWSDVDSAYWPGLRLHLVNCDTGRNQQRIKKHLNPTVGDQFPFQQAIREVTSGFLADFQRLVVN